MRPVGGPCPARYLWASSVRVNATRRRGIPCQCYAGLCQRQFPVLADEVAPKAVMRLLANQMKAGRAVNTAGGDQHIVRPQCDLAVAGPAGKADAFADQPAADGKAAGLGLDVEQTQLGDLVAILDQQYRANDFAIALGDPAALSPGIEVLDECRSNPCDEGLEALVQAIFLGVKRAVPMDDPPHVAGLVLAKNVGRLASLASVSEQPLDRSKRRN